MAGRALRLLLLAPPLLFVAAAFAVPMGAMLAEAAAPGAWGYATGPFVRRVLTMSLQQAAWSTAAAMALAVPLAWLHHRRRVPAPRLQLALHAAPFVMPVFVVVYGLQGAIGPHGPLDVLGWLGPFGAVVLAHAYYNYGFAARLLEAALRRRPHRMEEAARTLGASPARAFLRASLPALWPAGAAAAILVFLFTFGSFGVVLFLGAGRVWTLETAMYGELSTLFSDLPRAATLGSLQLLVNGLLLALYLAVRRGNRRWPAEAERPARPAGPVLSTLSWLAAGLAALPLAAVLVRGFRLRGEWSLAPWRRLLEDNPGGFDLASALRLSLLYAAVATLLALALTACLAYGARRLPWPLRRATEAFASLPVAGSGLLLGVAFLATFGVGGLVDIQGTVWIVLLAHTVLAFPFVARLVLPAFLARDARLDEAARLLGAPPRAVAARVHWPLLRPAILAAAGLAAALSLGDFGASSVLMESGTRGLSVSIPLVDGAYDPLFHSSAVALAGLLCALTLAAYVAVERIGVGTARKAGRMRPVTSALEGR